MKVLILAHSTCGDVQPYAALAVALQQAGHQAVLAAPAGVRGARRPVRAACPAGTRQTHTLLDDPSMRIVGVWWLVGLCFVLRLPKVPPGPDAGHQLTEAVRS